MKPAQAVRWVVTGVVELELPGCDELVGGREDSRGEMVYAELQAQDVVSRDAPSLFVVAQWPSPPSRRHIWIDDYWHWNGRAYVLERGHWALPPHAHADWVAPRYEKHEQGYRYIPGRWQEAQRERPGDDKPQDAPGRLPKERT
jgi:hypothetical protein